MAEQACQEAIAYDLMRDIMFEDPNRPKPNTAEFRGYVLDLYSECLVAVSGKRSVSPPDTRPTPRAPVTIESSNENCSVNSNGPAKQSDPLRNKKRLQQVPA